MKHISVKYIEVGKLRPYEGNARTHSDAQVTEIASSIRQFGFVNPILADDHLNIIAGHGRLEAAKQLGISLVPVITVSHLSERERKALTLADNKIALNSGWDYERLSTEISALIGLGFDVSEIGFDEQELDALLRSDVGVLPTAPVAGDAQQMQAGGGQVNLAGPDPPPVAPPELPVYGKQIATTYCCPSCGYKWSGKAH